MDAHDKQLIMNSLIMHYFVSFLPALDTSQLIQAVASLKTMEQFFSLSHKCKEQIAANEANQDDWGS